MPDYPFGLLIKTCDMLPNVPHSRMTPTLPLRPSHPWPGVAKGLGPRVKRRALPNSPKSAPLAGGRFQRPAKTRANTPSGAHLSRRRRVRKLVGEAEGVPRSVSCVRGALVRGRKRPRGADPCQEPTPCYSPPDARSHTPAGDVPRERAGRCRTCHAPHDGSPRGTRRRCHPLDVSLVWEDFRHPATVRHVGEHILY